MPAKRPRRGKSPRRSRGQYRPRVIVKFRDHIQLRHEQSAAREIEQRGIGPWQRLAAEFKGITIEPLFASKKAERHPRACQASGGSRSDVSSARSFNLLRSEGAPRSRSGDID
jgi:hypothetical protein